MFGLAITRREIDFRVDLAGALVQVREFADHFVRFIDPRFRFRRAGFGAATQPLDFGVHQIGEGVLPFALGVQIFFLRFQEFGVGTLHSQETVGVHPAEFDDVAGDIFQEIAIVADHYAGKLRILQQCFEPLDSGQIQVVGGFVEQHNVRLLHQAFDNRQALLPSAGKRRGWQIGIRKAGAAQRFGSTEVMVGVRDAGALQRSFDDRTASRTLGEIRNLSNGDQAGAFAYGNITTVRLDRAAKYFEQRRFSRAIRADQADAVAFGNGERNILEQRSRAEPFGQTLCINYRRQILLVSPASILPLIEGATQNDLLECWSSRGRKIFRNGYGINQRIV